MASRFRQHQLDTERFAELSERLLAQRLRVRFVVQGDSMAPLLRGGEAVVIDPLSEAPEIGGVVLCKHDNRLLLHRVRQVHRDAADGPWLAVTVSGDAHRSLGEDSAVRISAENVLGLMTEAASPPLSVRLRRVASRLARWMWSVAALMLLASGSAQAGSAFDVGTFTKSTAGAPVNQVINHTLGVAPKAILFWTSGNVTAATVQGGFAMGIGITDTTTSRAFGTASADAAGTSQNQRRYANTALTLVGPTGTTLAEATLNAVSTTTFTLRWTVNNGNAYIIHFLAIGGTDIQAKVGNFAMATAAGNQSITGVGFKPDFYLLIHGGSGLVNAAPATMVNSGLGFGYADASGDQWGFSMLGVNGSTTSDTYRSQRVDRSLTADTNANGGEFSKLAKWLSMDTGGFTLQYTDANANAGQVAYLAIKGVNVQASSFNKQSGTGTQAITGTGFQPKALFLASFQAPLNTAAPLTSSRMGLGMTDATTSESLAVSDTTALGTTDVNSITRTNRVFMKMNTAATVQAEADLSSMNANGFTLNWATGDTEATEILYLALASLPVTVAHLKDFQADVTEAGTALSWNTSYELDHLGFALYREDSGTKVQVGPALFPGAVLRAGAGTALTSGSSYSWIDSTPISTSTRYWLLATQLDGTTQWHGPVTPARRAHVRAKAGALVSAMAAAGSHPSPASLVRAPWRGLSGLDGADLDAHLALGGRAALKLGVSTDGWYHVSGDEIRAALGSTVDLNRLRLLREGHDVAHWIHGDGLEFFGLGLDGTHTDTRFYWLAVGGPPHGDPAAGATSSGAVTTTLAETVELQGRSIYFPALPDSGLPPFFSAAVTATGTTQHFALDSAAATDQDATLELELQGVTKQAHQIQVTVNGTPVGTVDLDGQALLASTLRIPSGAWAAGDLQVALSSLAGPTDISLLRTARVKYPRHLVAGGGPVAGTLSGSARLQIPSGDPAALRAIDLTNPDAPVSLAVELDQGGTNAEIHVPGAGTRSLYVYRPADVSPVTRQERLAHGPQMPQVAAARWIAVAPRAFLPSLQSLADRRAAEGWTPATVALEDVYDAFSFGSADPEALRRFFKSAWLESSGKRKLVLLVGDASFDPRHYLGTAQPDVLPATYATTDYLRAAAEDNWTDFNGDGRPDWPVGRLPVRTREELDAVVAKLLAPWASEAQAREDWVVGHKSEFDFESLFANSGVDASGHYTVWDPNVPAASPDAVFAAWAQSKPRIAGYLGHGSIATWSDGLLSSDLVPERVQGVRAPVLLSLSCLGGSFDDAFADSVGEAWVRLPDAGAQAVVALTGLAPPEEQVAAGRAFVDAAVGRGATLGDALLSAKQAVHSEDIRRTLLLLGDPAQRLVAPPEDDSGGEDQPVRTHGCGGGAGGLGAIALWAGLALLLVKMSQRSS